MSLAMTRGEREAFLAEVHVGILAVDEPGRGPTALPVWYLYDPVATSGALLVGMDGGSLKARLLRVAGRATFTVQSEVAPYRYVSVEGPVEVLPQLHDPLELATRYLGPELGRWYVDNNPTPDPVTARLRPEHWRTVDYGKGMGS